MARTVEDFEDFIFPYAPDAPSSIIQHAVRESIVRFMQETQVARDFAQFPLVAKTPDYIIDTIECRTIIDVVDVKFGCPGTIPDDSWNTLQRGVDYEVDLLHDGMPSIILKEAPQESCSRPLEVDMSVEYSWSISRDDCEIPDFIYERYMSEIKDGALAELYAIPGQEWTNLQYAMVLRQNVEEKYKQIRTKTKKRGSVPMKMRLGTSPMRRPFDNFWRA